MPQLYFLLLQQLLLNDIGQISPVCLGNRICSGTGSATSFFFASAIGRANKRAKRIANNFFMYELSFIMDFQAQRYIFIFTSANNMRKNAQTCRITSTQMYLC